jgi:flagellar motor switch protein FliN/FliY
MRGRDAIRTHIPVANRQVLPIIRCIGVASGASTAHSQGRAFVPLLQTQPGSSSSPSIAELNRILRLSVPVIVKLAERKLLLSEVMRLGTGAIIEFLKSSDEPLELLINNKPIGVGEAVKVGENFGLRITQIGDIKQIVAALGK